MARTKKQFDEIIDIEPEVDDAPSSPPPIMVKTREVREFIAPMQSPEPREPEPVVLIEPEPRAEPEPESMEARLRKEVGLTGNRWTMTVYRLLKYDETMNASLNGDAIAICTVPFDLDTYVDIILDRCTVPNKPNDFLPVVRRNNRVFCHLPVVRAESVARAEQPATQQGQTNNAIPAPVTPDYFAELKRTMKFMKELRELEAPAAPPAVPVGEVTTEQAILKVIASDPEQVSKIARRLLPGNDAPEEGMPGWVRELMPVVTPIFAALAQKFLMPQPVSQAAPQAQEPPPREIQAQEPPPQFHKYVELVGRLVAGLEKGYSPAYVGEDFDLACNSDELLIPFVNPLLAMAPATLQAELVKSYPQAAATLAKPESLAWLTEFLEYFQPEPESEVKA